MENLGTGRLVKSVSVYCFVLYFRNIGETHQGWC